MRVASVHGLGRDTADNYYSSQTLGYRVIPPWAEVKTRTSSWGGAPQRDTYITLKEGDWLFDKPLQKKLFEDSYSDTFISMPTQMSQHFPYTDEKKSAERSTCTCWTSTATEMTVSSGNSCLNATTEDCLVDSLHTWKDDASNVKTNIANRMLQEEALKYAQTSGFTTIIVVQWADLMICKTRWLSIADQGMVNPLMNFGLLFETILGSMMCYFTPLGAALNTRPLRFTHWFPGMPFCIFIFFYDETRKYLMRQTEKDLPEDSTIKKMGSWLKENTYY